MVKIYPYFEYDVGSKVKRVDKILYSEGYYQTWTILRHAYGYTGEPWYTIQWKNIRSHVKAEHLKAID